MGWASFELVRLVKQSGRIGRPVLVQTRHISRSRGALSGQEVFLEELRSSCKRCSRKSWGLPARGVPGRAEGRAEIFLEELREELRDL
ncbi:hypothetical protein F511_09073 [Dorcoceras hygrometricum]|uniref:Uncharacterized protein n=1 Tax=Dorcoceras hygrometricum TaxID=472368 RepID=A0A2Z7DBF4_9LAMI|nr:hypothetical protein F511_09073 [Dorcoceras hygrometricum]